MTTKIQKCSGFHKKRDADYHVSIYVPIPFVFSMCDWEFWISPVFGEQLRKPVMLYKNACVFLYIPYYKNQMVLKG